MVHRVRPVQGHDEAARQARRAHGCRGAGSTPSGKCRHDGRRGPEADAARRRQRARRGGQHRHWNGERRERGGQANRPHRRRGHRLRRERRRRLGKLNHHDRRRHHRGRGRGARAGRGKTVLRTARRISQARGDILQRQGGHHARRGGAEHRPGEPPEERGAAGGEDAERRRH